MNEPEIVTSLVIKAFQEVCDTMDIQGIDTPNAGTVLYGAGGCLKSLALVNLISVIEEKVYDQYNQDIVLANEKALSQARSPFNTIESLSQYVVTMLQEKSHG
jgi:D-alanine--poly(phosphoribitol) ligase subunit 2